MKVQETEVAQFIFFGKVEWNCILQPLLHLTWLLLDASRRCQLQSQNPAHMGADTLAFLISNVHKTEAPGIIMPLNNETIQGLL